MYIPPETEDIVVFLEALSFSQILLLPCFQVYLSTIFFLIFYCLALIIKALGEKNIWLAFIYFFLISDYPLQYSKVPIGVVYPHFRHIHTVRLPQVVVRLACFLRRRADVICMCTSYLILIGQLMFAVHLYDIHMRMCGDHALVHDTLIE